MTAADALVELFNRIGASGGMAILVNAEELRRWPKEAIAAMMSQKLMVKAGPADSAICPGCELQCVMPVHNLASKTGASSSFILCDKRDDTNRVFVSPERLIQFQCSPGLISGFVATSLGMGLSPKHKTDPERWEIGMALGDKRSQMLCLGVDGALNLIAGNNKIPLADLVEFQDGKYLLDNVMVRRLVDASTTADERYTKSNARREARKLDTQAKYERWQKAYREWQKKKPGMSDSWYSQQIAKKENGKGCDSETIRKHMKR
jgi:hypothetical protein